MNEIDNIKFLGILIDKNLTWKQHIAYVSGKISHTELDWLSRHVSICINKGWYHSTILSSIHMSPIIIIFMKQDFSDLLPFKL